MRTEDEEEARDRCRHDEWSIQEGVCDGQVPSAAGFQAKRFRLCRE